MDDGQYYYLDRGQYNLLGELGYLLGHPCYPKLFERDLDQAVGFTNRPHIGWFSLYGGQVPISEYAVWSYHFNAGDYIDRGRYYYLDIARRGMVLQSLMRLKQICNHPSQLTGDGDYIASDSGKFLRLGEICDEIQ